MYLHFIYIYTSFYTYVYTQRYRMNVYVSSYKHVLTQISIYRRIVCTTYNIHMSLHLHRSICIYRCRHTFSAQAQPLYNIRRRYIFTFTCVYMYIHMSTHIVNIRHRYVFTLIHMYTYIHILSMSVYEHRHTQAHTRHTSFPYLARKYR